MQALGQKQLIMEPHARYAVWRSGQGPLVVLLHGWPVTSHRWRLLVPALAAAGLQTLAIDLKGLGESTSFDTIFDKQTLAQEILQLITTVVPDAAAFHVVGHDWGGSIALAMAAIAPEKIMRLVIEDEVPPGINAPLQGESIKHYSSWHGAFHRTPNLPELLISGHEDAYLSFFLNLRNVPLALEDREQYLKHHRTTEKTITALAYYRAFDVDATFFASLQQHPIKNPILTIAGNYGMGAAVATAITQIATNVQSVLLEGIGHYPAEETPDDFNRRVIEFLAKT